MTVSMQGSWTVSVQSKAAAWGQRFRIAGSTNGVDNVYTGSTTTPPVFVTGDQWGIIVEHNPAGPVSWTPSRQRLSNFRVSGGQFMFEVLTDDTYGDEDFNDLILTCSMPLSTSEYVVYGNVKTYSKYCIFNPCYTFGYSVVETLAQLEILLEYEPARRVLEKLYPERVKPRLKRPFPEPDPAPFRPMMIPSGLPDGLGLVVEGKAEPPEIVPKRAVKKGKATAANENPLSMQMIANIPSTRVALEKEDLLVFNRLKDKLKFMPCTTSPISETILRFIEYDRTEAEKLGDPYTGEGNRTILGQTATDELGNYVFQFSQSIIELADETTDAALDEDLATQLRPDIIIQIMEHLPDGIAYESASYFNIPNIKRINLCLPETALGFPQTACQGGRAIQAIGDLILVPNPSTTLYADGTISSTASTGPQVQHAAWRGTLDLIACFVDITPKIAYYTIKYRRDGESTWHRVTEPYKYFKKQPDGTFAETLVGPIDVTVGSVVKVEDAYQNIEVDSQWLMAHRLRKIQLYTRIYQAVVGAVEFKIEGYKANGDKVPSAEDTVKLYLDNHESKAAIDYIKLGTEDPGECALFELPAADSALTVRYRATDPEGFMQDYKLKVWRGSNTPVPIEDTATGAPVEFEYQNVAPYRFTGTLGQVLDPSGYREITVAPALNGWLPPDRSFCAFSFEITTLDRTTDGYYTPGRRLLWRELVGISHEPPATP